WFLLLLQSTDKPSFSSLTIPLQSPFDVVVSSEVVFIMNSLDHSSLNDIDHLGEHSNHTQGLLQIGKWKIAPQYVIGGGVGLLAIVIVLAGFAFWFLSFRMRRREENETEKVKQRARDDFESKKQSTPSAKKKLADKEAEKKREADKKKTKTVPSSNSIDSVNSETIAQFETRVRDTFSPEKILEEIREETSPNPERKGDTVSQVSFDQLNRNDSKVNMFKENEDADTNQPALGKGINLEEKIT
ncbi:hypothetical protein PMAYCL1PPCAC_18094, partial [Pristionchus mayeri]